MSTEISNLPAEAKRALLAQLLKQKAARAEAPAPLSYGQRAWWFLYQLEPQNAAYNIILPARILSELDVEALRRALAALVRRHASLRTTFAVEEGRPVQRVNPTAEIDLVVEDASAWDEERLERALLEESHRSFDLERGPVMRLNLFNVSPREHVLLMTVHHIAFDLWSLVIFMHELRELYAAARAGRDAALEPLRRRYTDYVREQERLLAGPEGERLWDYWKERLSGELPVLDLPTFRPRPPVQTYRGAAHRFTLDAALARRLKALGREAEATPYMTLLAAYQVLLHRYTGQNDIIVGSLAASGRQQAEFAKLVGFFDNQVALRADLSGNPTFREFLAQVRRVVLGAFEHQQYPFPLLVERLQPARDSKRAPLFQTMFILQKAQLPEEVGLLGFGLGMSKARLELGELTLESVDFERRVAGGLAGQLELTLIVADIDDKLEASLQYNPDVFDADTIARMASHFQNLLAAAVAAPDERVAALPLLGEEERRGQVFGWNDTAAPYDSLPCLHRSFEAQAARAPEAVACVFRGRSLTYGELNRRANQVAHFLRARAVGPGVRVAICFERSFEMVVALLGILKAGGAYVPLDPAYPADRLAFMIEDIEAPFILTQQKLVGALPAHGGEAVCLDSGWDAIAAQSETDPEPNTTARDLAYLIYTSGSTGRPKGVMIDHRGAANTIADMNSRYGVGPADRVLGLSSLSFDLSVYDVLGTLAAGAALVIPSPSASPDPADWLTLVEREGVTVWNSAPALMELFVEYVCGAGATVPDALRLVLMSGDWIPVKLPDQIRARARRAEVHSLGGATEASIWSITFPVGQVDPLWKSIPYGQPMVNQRFHVLDPLLQPAPVGVVGELYIGGIGVALGYHSRQGLTAEKFIPDPFSSEPGMRLYRTGDLGRYLPDGNIEFLGRIDGQVKVRGFRIELGEVEAALAQHPSVRENVVLVKASASGEKQLVAYVVARQEGRVPGAGRDDAEDASVWQQLVEAGGRQAELPTVILEPAVYTPLTGGLARLAVAYLSQTFARLGVFTRAGEALTHRELIERCGVVPRYEKAVGRWLELLAARGVLGRRGAAFVCDFPLEAEPIAAIWAEVEAASAGQQFAESFGYFRACGENLPGVLTGRIHPTQILFEGGESKTAEGFYDEGFRYCNAIAREVVRSLAQTHAPSRPLRVLEVGAGVGSTTAWLLPVLPEGRADYTYTDVSRYFLEVGKKNFGHHGSLRFAVLDIERDPQSQGYEPHSFDLVVASSVLHATRDVRETLRHVRSLLAPRGHLLLIEETRFHDWFNVVGIQEGFDRFEDEGLRGSHPFLNTEEWVRELEALGFGPSASFNRDRFTSELLGLDVIVAQAAPVAPALDKNELRAFLRERLPEYMVPTAFVALDRLPLTPNGKVDRKALPAPEQGTAAREFVAPRTPTEQVLAALWSQVLNVEAVGAEDNFFELGGDSLLATQLMTRLRAALDAEVPLHYLFEAPTLAALAEKIEPRVNAGGGARLPPLRPTPRDGKLALSFAQQRLWFLDRLVPGNPFYNATSAVRLSGALDRDVLARCLGEIVRRHESLRTTFTESDGEPVQVINPAADAPFEPVFFDLSGLAEGEREESFRRLGEEVASAPFDLTAGPLLRVTLVRLGEAEHALLLTFHHIIYDGWSFGVFLRELTELYTAFLKGEPSPLPELPVQYADFAAWQRQWLTGEVAEGHLAYWRGRLEGCPTLELPTDRPRPEAQTFNGARHCFVIPPALAESLKALSRQEDVTFFMTLLAALKVLLSRYSGAEDIVVGSPVANRMHADLDGLIGFFLNALPLRTDLSGDPTFAELLGRVRETALGAYEHQDLPFERLVEELSPERATTHTPFFRVWFAMQNAPMPALSLPGLELAMMQVDEQTSKFDLVLTAFETGQGLAATWVYNTDLFDAETVARMTRHFETLLADLASRPGARISALEIVTAEERRRQTAESSRRKAANLERLRATRRKGVGLSQVSVTRAAAAAPDRGLPLVVRPAVGDADLIAWVRRDHAAVREKLLKHGAILFRGFETESVAAFGEFASSVCSQLYTEYGDLPRDSEGQKIYTSTPYPADRMILYHNESSHMHQWPQKIMFHCVTAARSGGETPIADCREMYRRLDAGLRRRFEEKGLLYVRNFKQSLDVRWQEFFRTEDPAVVERYCRAAGEEFEWVGGTDLRTRKVRPAVLTHPFTGERVFFNQMLAHHPSCLDSGERASLLELFGADGLPRDVRYGDGTPIEDSVIAEVKGLYDEAAIALPWEEGDIMLLDNMLTAHGRNPFTGPRKIVVAMGELFSLSDFGAWRAPKQATV